MATQIGAVMHRKRTPALTRHDVPDRARQALQYREQGRTWAEVAERYGYANQRSARTSVLWVARDDEHRTRLKAIAPAVQATAEMDNGNGYKLVHRRDHPLAGKRGTVYLHRAVLYDAIGPGSHPCHHCGTVVTWGIDLEVDHLDRARGNNDLSNLVASCLPCNRKPKAEDPHAR